MYLIMLIFIILAAMFIAGSSTLVRNIKHYKPQKCGLFYVKFYLFLCCMALFYML